MFPETDVRYRIDSSDQITFVGAAWDKFAQENDGSELEGRQLIGRSLWDFISDDATRQLYRQIIARARQGAPAQFKLRCDAPSCKRLLQMTVSSDDSGGVEFITHSLESERRAAVPLLARTTGRSDRLVTLCSWCNRIDIGASEWVEVEVAVEKLRLFDDDQQPQLTHGMCAECYARMKTSLGGEQEPDRGSAHE